MKPDNELHLHGSEKLHLLFIFTIGLDSFVIGNSLLAITASGKTTDDVFSRWTQRLSRIIHPLFRQLTSRVDEGATVKLTKIYFEKTSFYRIIYKPVDNKTTLKQMS